MQQTQPHVIWINGAFGSGKTTAAKLLAQKAPGAVIVDLSNKITAKFEVPKTSGVKVTMTEVNTGFELEF